MLYHYVNKNTLPLAMTPRIAVFALEIAQNAPERSCALFCIATHASVAKPRASSL
jgi:hypothetical protein